MSRIKHYLFERSYMNESLFSADLRKQSPELTRQAYIQSVDDLLWEATMEAESKRRQGNEPR